MSSNRAKGQHNFRLTAAVTIGALVLAVIGLTLANAVQGPRLLDALINPGAAVESAGERLVLRVDQTIANLTADQVDTDRAARADFGWRRAEPAFH
jgi:hypothetical protein